LCQYLVLSISYVSTASCITMPAMLEDLPRPPARRASGPPDTAAPRQPLYDYYMVQIPSVFPVERGAAVIGTEIANYVQRCANEFSAAGGSSTG
jgi:hypothetical protein